MPEFFAAETAGKYIDCGAYVGDTIERYIWERIDTYGDVNRIIAFEPNVENYNVLLRRVDRLKKEWNLNEGIFKLYNAGVGEKTSVGVIADTASGSIGAKFVDDGEGAQTKIYSIDDIVNERYSYLKADIESYEYYMLIGAMQSIREYSPNLAICIYHNVVDFYQIPMLIHEINPNYKVIIRHHSYNLAETILYAWI